MRSYNEKIGGEILLVRRYQGGREDQNGSGPGLVLFRMVVHPLQPEVVGAYICSI
jgi:hypothetical protein